MSAEIRTMTPDDYEQAVSLWKRSGLPVGAADTRRAIERLLRRNPGMSFVAELDGALIGTVVGSFDGRRGWVRKLAVAEPHRDNDIGRRLMDAVERAFCEREIAFLSLNVTQDNLAVVNYYERLGWDVREDVITMSKTLDVTPPTSLSAD